MPRIKEFIKRKILGLKGLVEYQSTEDENRLMLISDDEMITRSKIQEYLIWYYGDSDELLNYYTRQNIVDYYYEPFYSRNKRNYFWSISSTENDIKRTHSGQPRNIVDTLVAICKYPDIRASTTGDDKDIVNKNLNEILKDSHFKEIYKQEQMPLTLVEGWGCYKINWDQDITDYPFPVYYRAENVDFIYTAGRIVGVIFKDYYTDGKMRKYMLAETRYIKREEDGTRVLVIDKELFRVQSSTEYISGESFDRVPELKDVVPHVEIENFDKLFAVPCILFKNTDRAGGPGRSIFTGKIDLFDDLDQCLSQSSNTVRRSTTMEYFNTDFLERDEETGLPKQPKAYDRKYTLYMGQKNSEGVDNAGSPVQVTQPQVNFEQYSNQAVSILIQIINGIMSPATLGIDIAKKDNAEAQREKEKVTIFTRNDIIDSEEEILKDLCSQLLCAYEFMHKGVITCKKYDISIKFSEFADDSFENKLEKLGGAYDSEQISDEMYMQRLYGDSLNRAEYDKELEWLKEHHTKPRVEGMKGAGGGGMNQPEGPGADVMSAMMGGEEDDEF